MRRDVKRPLLRRQPLDDIKTGLIDGALGLLCVFKSHADLVAQLRPLVTTQVSLGLCEVVFEKVEEGIVGGFRGAGVVEDEGAVGYESVGRFETLGLGRSEEHTSELQSQSNLVCRLLLEKKK